MIVITTGPFKPKSPVTIVDIVADEENLHRTLSEQINKRTKVQMSNIKVYKVEEIPVDIETTIRIG